MTRKTTRPVVRMDRFKKQFAEEVIGEGSLEKIEIGDGEFVWIKLPIMLDADDDFQDQMQAAQASDDPEAVPLVVLGAHPEHDGAEQLARWKAAGYDLSDLAAVFASELNAAQERLKDFRYGG